MSALGRGVRNAVRNPGRALAVTVILGLSLAMALSMAVARQAVGERMESAQGDIDNVLSNLATSLVVRPAGAGGFGGGFGGGGGGPEGQNQVPNLSQERLAGVAEQPHVATVVLSLTVQVPSSQTDLSSALNFSQEARNGRGGGRFTIPITAIGTTDLSALAQIGGGSATLAAGAVPDLTGQAMQALVGTELATHNNLSPGSTFHLYGQTLSVAGTFSAGSNRFGSTSLVLPLGTLQTLSNRTDEVSVAIVRADAAANTGAVKTELEATLGDSADIVDLQEQSSQSSALQSASDSVAKLESVSGIATASLIGSLAAGTVIVLLTMYMVVRERRREIGVLKALGASTARVVTQFTAEALVFTGFAAIVGLTLAALFGNTVTHALVAANVAAPTTPGFGGPGGGFGGGPSGFGGGAVAGLFGVSTTNIDATFGIGFLFLGLGTAVVVAVLGSAIPALVISKVRPSEVLRSD